MNNGAKLILNGLSLDKNTFEKVLQGINKDRDIHLLIRRARRLIWSRTLFLVVVLAVIILIIIHTSISNHSKITLSLTSIGVAFGTFVVLLKLGNLFRGLIKTFPELFRLCQYLRSPKSPKNNFDLWYPFTSNLSDSQTMLTAFNFFSDVGYNPTIKYAFCGEPYYNVKYIDSILLTVPAKIKKIYKVVYKEHVLETFINASEGKIFKKEARQWLQSKFVFGIFFFSKFLFRITTSDQGKAKQDPQPEFKFLFDVSENLKEDIRQFAIECIKLSSDPERTHFNKDDFHHSNIIEIRVDNLYTLGQEKPGKLLANQILIPFKRFIAIPKKYDNSVDKNRPFNIVTNGDVIIPQLESFKDVDTIYCIGGAEHNLALLHIINLHRWEMKHNRKFSIAEI